MANADTPMGFKPFKYQNGAPYDGKARVVYAPSGTSDRIGLYDLVTPSGTADTLGHYLTVTRSAAAEEDILGSVIGFGYTPYMAVDFDDLGANYRVAADPMYLWIADDPALLYLAQDDAGATGTAGAVGSNCEITAGDCSTTTGLSIYELGFGSLSTSAAQIRIEGLNDEPNNVLGDNATWVCRINEHAYRLIAGA